MLLKMGVPVGTSSDRGYLEEFKRGHFEKDAYSNSRSRVQGIRKII